MIAVYQKSSRRKLYEFRSSGTRLSWTAKEAQAAAHAERARRREQQRTYLRRVEFVARSLESGARAIFRDGQNGGTITVYGETVSRRAVGKRMRSLHDDWLDDCRDDWERPMPIGLTVPMGEIVATRAPSSAHRPSACAS